MIRRVGKNLAVLSDEVPEASVELERNGFAVLRSVFSDDEVAALRGELDEVFATTRPERGRSDEYRYEMLNRGRGRRRRSANPAILAAIEPLLGDDCHVIANTAWRNPPEFAGGPWHCDAGPHVPRPKGVEWDDRIPYPVFAIGAHLLLQDCRRLDGPTAVVPGSHRSGRLAPVSQIEDPDLTYDGRAPRARSRARPATSRCSSPTCGIVARRPTGGSGRCFLQVHYGRRDIAQRIRTTRPSTSSRPRRSTARRPRAARPRRLCTPRTSTTGDR